MNLILNKDTINPAYVQINRKQAAAILGVSPTELDRLRKNDPRCPTGFKKTDNKMAAVKFCLADVYAYSEAIMANAIPASRTDYPSEI